MSKKSLPLTIAAILLAGLGAAPAAASPALSWGKAGVSFEDYRADATNCLREAVATDLSGTEPARALILASRQIETGLNNDYTPMINGAAGLEPMSARPSFDPGAEAAQRFADASGEARVEHRIRQARDIMAARLESCLAGRGYHRFHLTAAQRRQLDRLPERAPGRQAYLHRLASDPQILAAQSE
jgi:hypothetical protein